MEIIWLQSLLEPTQRSTNTRSLWALSPDLYEHQPPIFMGINPEEHQALIFMSTNPKEHQPLIFMGTKPKEHLPLIWELTRVIKKINNNYKLNTLLQMMFCNTWCFPHLKLNLLFSSYRLCLLLSNICHSSLYSILSFHQLFWTFLIPTIVYCTLFCLFISSSYLCYVQISALCLFLTLLHMVWNTHCISYTLFFYISFISNNVLQFAFNNTC